LGYLQVKKYDKVRKIYICKGKQGEEVAAAGKDETEELTEYELKREEISESILIQVRMITD
jgi:hypothetical protein